MKTVLLGVVLLVSPLTSPGAVSAQGSVAIRGTVVDDSGAPLPGAVVALIMSDQRGRREMTADRAGAFSFSDIPSGSVRLHVELSGFQPADLKVTVEPGRTTEVTARLKAGFEEEVTVAAEASGSVLSPARNADAVEFDPEALRRLPTDAQDLQAIVEQFTGAGPVGSGSVVIDGVETSSLGVPASAIHRLTLNRNPYSAEFKSPGKSRVEVETERGSRRFYHGSGASFVRNSALEASNPFAVSSPDRSRALNEGTLAGPLLSKGWSFFASAQHLIDNDEAVVNAQTTSGAVVQNVATPERRTVALGRVDFRPNKTDAITLRYDISDDAERNHGIGGLRLPEQAYDTTERRHRLQANEHRVVGGGVLNDLRIEAAASNRQDGRVPQAAAVVVPGAFTGGPSQVSTSDRSRSIQLQDTASVTVGAHTVRFGARLKRRWTDVTDASNFGGTFEFKSLSTFNAGSSLLFTQRSGNPIASFADTDGNLFIETTVQPSGAVGITAGLRYDWQARVADWNNLSPRLAIAFAPAGRRTVFRGGFGLFHATLGDEPIARARLFGSDGLRERTVAGPSFTSTSSSIGASPGPSTTWRLDPSLQSPSALQTSVSVERALWRRTTVTAEYLLVRTSNAFRTRNLNSPRPGGGSRPDPSFLNVFQIEATGSSLSDSMSLTFNGRIAGFKGTIQYVLSRTTDDASSVFDLPVDSDRLDLERGRADFDRRHRFNLAGTYGWMKDRVRLGGVLAVSSGSPFNITTGGDDNRDLVANDRPAGVTRNTGQGPAFAQLDLRLTKVFRLPRPPSQDPESAKREQVDNFEVNLDVFNALNHVNPTTFIGVVTSPLFGRANASRMARTAQLSLRYRF